MSKTQWIAYTRALRQAAKHGLPPPAHDRPTGLKAPVAGSRSSALAKDLLRDGSVLAIGGTVAERWDPVIQTFSMAGSMAHERGMHTATLLSDGRVLVAGGDDGEGKHLASVEVWSEWCQT